MPRPKPKTASPTFLAYPHTLSDGAREKLLDLLGYPGFDLRQEAIDRQMPGHRVRRSEPGAPLLLVKDPDADKRPRTDLGMAILKIEGALGLFVDGAQHLDNIPRPADYVATFKRLRTKAADLLNDVTGTSGYFQDQFQLKGADLHAIETALAVMLDTSNKVLREFEGKSSKGARKNNALCEVIRRLRKVFRDNYSGPRTGRVKRGAFQFKGEEERRELEFVKTALVDARIIMPAYRELPRLLRDSRCSLPSDRPQVLRRIAASVHRAARRKQKTECG
jgi:hypothetical protein